MKNKPVTSKATRDVFLDRIEDQRDKTYSTKSHKKLWSFFLDLIKTELFQNKVALWRRKYGIPQEGFVDEEMTIYPKGVTIQQQGKYLRLEDEVYEFCEQQNLHYIDWGEAIQTYIFYGRADFSHDINHFNLCHIVDMVREKKYPYDDYITKMDDLIFPIGIRISPYASNNDIVDYVRKMADVIDDYQRMYRKPEVRVGKTKAKRASERDEFIYKNRDKTGKEIAQLVKERFGGQLLSYEYIPKIIHREGQKRRQKV